MKKAEKNYKDYKNYKGPAKKSSKLIGEQLGEIKKAGLMQEVLKLPDMQRILGYTIASAILSAAAVLYFLYPGMALACPPTSTMCISSILLSMMIMTIAIAILIFLGISLGTMCAEVIMRYAGKK